MFKSSTNQYKISDELYEKYRDMKTKQLEWYLYNTSGEELKVVKELLNIRKLKEII